MRARIGDSVMNTIGLWIVSKCSVLPSPIRLDAFDFITSVEFYLSLEVTNGSKGIRFVSKKIQSGEFSAVINEVYALAISIRAEGGRRSPQVCMN